MTNDPYREPSGLGDQPPGYRGGGEAPSPDPAWMPPADPTAAGPSEPYRPPADQSQPPTDQPPGYQPPAEQPPGYQPPAYQPPGYQPPADQPPAAGVTPPGGTPSYQTTGQPYPGATSAPYGPAGAPAAGQPYQAPPVPGYPSAQRPTNGLAVAALVCSIAGVLTLISAPIGAVLGHLALRQIGQTGEEGAPLAKAAIWVGWIITGLVVVACCAVLAFAIAASRSGEFAPR